MLKIIVVDDSEKRVDLIKKTLSGCEFFTQLDLSYVETADKARQCLLEVSDILILDVLIPKKLKGIPQAVHSFNLLTDISNSQKKYIRPNLIIGLTADTAELGNYRNTFYENASIVLDGSLSNHDWLNAIIKQIRTALESKKKASQLTHDKVLITIHGIRTFGKWQGNLANEIKSYSKSFDFIEIKYGFFDLVSFIFPPLRNRKTKQIAKRLKKNIITNKDKDITIIAHSYGTIILSDALKELEHDCKIENIILCGSPLTSSFNIEHFISSAKLTVNECGTKDYILVASKCLVLGLGDAGKSGFDYDNSAKFLNRYFNGGHDLYTKEKPNEVSFSSKYWLPLIISSAPPIMVDERKNYIGEDLLHILSKFAYHIKPFTYIASFLLLLFFLY